MEKMVEFACTVEQLETIKKALKTELELNYGECFKRHKNPSESKKIKTIKSTLETINNWKI